VDGTKDKPRLGLANNHNTCKALFESQWMTTIQRNLYRLHVPFSKGRDGARGNNTRQSSAWPSESHKIQLGPSIELERVTKRYNMTDVRR